MSNPLISASSSIQTRALSNQELWELRVHQHVRALRSLSQIDYRSKYHYDPTDGQFHKSNLEILDPNKVSNWLGNWAAKWMARGGEIGYRKFWQLSIGNVVQGIKITKRQMKETFNIALRCLEGRNVQHIAKDLPTLESQMRDIDFHFQLAKAGLQRLQKRYDNDKGKDLVLGPEVKDFDNDLSSFIGKILEQIKRLKESSSPNSQALQPRSILKNAIRPAQDTYNLPPLHLLSFDLNFAKILWQSRIDNFYRSFLLFVAEGMAQFKKLRRIQKEESSFEPDILSHSVRKNIRNWVVLNYSFTARPIPAPAPLRSLKGFQILPSIFRPPMQLAANENGSYLTSVLQAFFCIGQMRAQLRSLPISASNTLRNKREKIQAEILKLIPFQFKEIEEKSNPLSLPSPPSLSRLREAIFQSGLHLEFKMNTLKEQHDTAAVAELLTGLFLPKCQFRRQEHTTTPALPGLEFKSTLLFQNILQLPLETKFKDFSLENLIQETLGMHIKHERDPRYQRSFDPKKGTIIKGREWEGSLYVNGHRTKVAEFSYCYRFIEFPHILVIQLKRFINRKTIIVDTSTCTTLTKVDATVPLPQDGILDLSSYYASPNGEEKQALYKIRSIVRHTGTLDKGLYTAYVEINGNYYKCIDQNPTGYQEIEKELFYSDQDAYLLVLEKKF